MTQPDNGNWPEFRRNMGAHHGTCPQCGHTAVVGLEIRQLVPGSPLVFLSVENPNEDGGARYRLYRGYTMCFWCLRRTRWDWNDEGKWVVVEVIDGLGTPQ